MGDFGAASVLLAASLVIAVCLGVLLRDAGLPVEPGHVLAMAACLAAGVTFGMFAVSPPGEDERRRPEE